MKKIFYIAAFLLCTATCTPLQSKIIIVSFNVLFRPNEKIIEQHVRESLNIFRSIGLLFSGIPTKTEIKRQLFSTLETIPLASLAIKPELWQSPYAPWDVDYAYPPILNQIITSATFEQEKIIYNRVVTEINRSSLSKTRKIILTCIADFLFQHHWMNRALEPMHNMVHLLQSLKAEGHTLLLVAGVPGHAWDTYVRHPHQQGVIQMLFEPEKCYVSGKQQLLPTSPAMYDRMLREQNLDPADCIVIAHNVHDLAYPKSIGMQTIVYNPATSNYGAFQNKLKTMLA